MLEWLGLAKGLVRGVTSSLKAVKGMAREVDRYWRERDENAAKFATATLGFPRQGMKGILKKIENNTAVYDDIHKLQRMLDESYDEVNHILLSLQFHGDIGKIIIDKAGLKTAMEFEEAIGYLKGKIRLEILDLTDLDTLSDVAIEKATKISIQIDEFNRTLGRLHEKIFRSPVTTNSRNKKTARRTVSNKVNPTGSRAT